MLTGQRTARLELRLLGSFQVALDGEPLDGIRSDKTRALLTYLAVEADRAHSRDTLGALLWGEHSETAARASLRSSLSNLRQRLVRQLAPDDDHPILDITRHTVRFDADPSICWLDAAEFDALIAACHAHLHRDLAHCPVCLPRLERAVGLYRGDFLTGLALPDSPAFDEWRVVQQELRHQQALIALEALAACYLAVGNYARAREYVRRQLALEPWREEAHRQLMHALALDGQRSAALAQYETCQRLLAEELGVEPAPETEALYGEIRAGELTPVSRAADPTAGTPSFFEERLISQLAVEHSQIGNPVVWISLHAGDNTDLDRFFNVLAGALDEIDDAQLQAFFTTNTQALAPLAS